ncbi:MAG: 2OG-Fe(II) oxygenase [Pseudoxanthomonas suwonensis]|nr:2OG-Fe(II) oxygenase [Pseudoxanthomonas suwonensis]
MPASTAPRVDPALAQWMLDRVRAGDTPQAMLEAMLAQGWQQQSALEAIEHTLQAHVDAVGAANALPARVAVPQPVAANDTWELDLDGHRVHVLASMLLPRVVVLGGFLSADECRQMIQLARHRLAPSTTLNLETGEDQQVGDRSSEGVFFQRGEHPLCARIEARIARLLDWPVENGEGLQVLRYGPGAEYRPHYDYFDPRRPGTAATLQRGGQRVASLVIYLNTPHRGGATTFPDVHLEVGAVAGNAVFFSYDRAHPLTRSLHGGAPVTEGEKWVATKWLRQARHD